MSEESWAGELRWAKLTAEAVAIIASILIAFAIDAAWDAKQDRAELDAVLTSLRGEFVALRDTLDYWTTLTERRAAELSTFLETLDSDFDSSDLPVLDSTIYAVVNMADWDPRGGVIAGVIASGQLDLLTDDRLQSELGSWPGAVDDATDNQHLMQDFVLNQLIPALARSGYSVSRAFGMSRPNPETWPANIPSDRESFQAYQRLAQDQEVLDLIAAKYAFVNSSASDFRRASEAAVRIISLTDSVLSR